MNTRDPLSLIAKLKDLPPERVAKVEDFVDFLRTREEERSLERAATRTAEPTFLVPFPFTHQSAITRR